MIWLLEHVEQLDPAEVLACLHAISEVRRARVLGMKNGSAQIRSILAELLLRHALLAEYGLTELPGIGFGEKGKPFFPDRPDLQFSLSHCKTAAACALDSAPVGVDVQEVRCLRRRAGQCDPPVYRALSAPERAWVKAGRTAAEQDRRFTAVWTCKEAYGKARADGILYEIKSTEFLPAAESWRQYGFTFRQWALDDAVLTLCGRGELPLQTVSFSEL